MGVINKTTDEINTLLEKVENMPSEGGMGKTPVLQTGTTTTLEAGSNATSQVVSKGEDLEGNPIYAINFGIPRGADGKDGSSTGGGGTADSVQWSNVLNKPSWVNSSVKPNYTALEVGAIASGGLKTINGQSLEGQGDITISGGSGSGGIPDAPRDGEVYTRTNGNWTAPYEINGKKTAENNENTQILQLLLKYNDSKCINWIADALKHYNINDNLADTYIQYNDIYLYEPTVLHIAVICGNTDVIRLLIDYGADIYAEDESGEPVFMLADIINNEEIIEIFTKEYENGF